MERRRGLIGPILLIAIGIVLLLNTLNVLPWGIWGTLWRFWPVLLILIGLEILFGRSSWVGSLIVLIVAVIAIVAIVLLSLTPTLLTTRTGERQTISQPLGDIRQAEVTIDFSVGSARLYRLADSPNLMEATIDNAPGRRVETTWEVSGDTGRLRIHEARTDFSFFPFLGPQVDSRWEIGLSDRLPLALKLSTGVGQSTLDLSGLRLTRLELDTGVGQTLLTLPAEGHFDVDIRGGVGNTVITVPRGLAVRVRASQGLGNVSVTVPDVLHQDNEWVSRNFDTAESRAEIRISGGVGSIVVR